jgi:8-oxo-dGTP pyrophosphatase MutT (NUDIX family)
MNEEPIRAAGGIVEGVGRNKGKIAVISRRRYKGEIALPKGKLNPGEDEKTAARREVEEETGIKAVLRERAGETRYGVGGRSKTVTYFLMEALSDAPTQPRDAEEVNSIEWLTPEDAIARLSHAEDKEMIERIFVNRLPGIGKPRTC